MNEIPGLEEPVEMAPDLDWLLQSGQASDQAVARALAAEFYPSLLRLAVAFYGDEAQARETCVSTLARATAERGHYQPGSSIPGWFWRLALAELRRGNHKPPRGSQDVPPGLLARLAALPAQERLALLLAELLEWPQETVALALELQPPAYLTALEQARTKLAANGEGDAEPSQETLRQELIARYPALQVTSEELDRLAAQAAHLAAPRLWRGRMHLREAALAGIIILILIGLYFWQQRLLRGDVALNLLAATPSSTPLVYLHYYTQEGDTLEDLARLFNIPAAQLKQANHLSSDGPLPAGRALDLFYGQYPWERSGTATPVVPVAHRAAPLSLASSEQDVRAYLSPDRALWRTAWLDLQIVYYGPPGYIGPPVGYRMQTWASQPGRMLTVFGISEQGDIGRSLLVDGLGFYLSENQGSVFQVQRGDQIFDRSGGLLYGFLGGIWSDYELNFRLVGEEHLAGRPALVVEWARRDTGSPLGGFPPYLRMWVDAVYGVPLRMQIYGDAEYSVLVWEFTVKQIIYDIPLPPELFSPLFATRQGFALDPSGAPEPTPDPSVPTPTLPPAPGRERLSRQPLLAGFDVATSNLVFQYPESLPQGIQRSQVEVFAGGYYLGLAGLPGSFNAQCDRSPDGRWLAFTGPLNPWSNAQTGNTLFTWIDLSQLPLSQFTSKDISGIVVNVKFSPDSRRLALSVINPNKIALLDLETSLVELVKAGEYAEGMVWSPDGRYLAYVSPPGSSYPAYGYVLDLQSREKVYSVQLDDYMSIYQDPNRLPEDWPASDWPTHAWGVKFPDLDYDMGSCAKAP